MDIGWTKCRWYLNSVHQCIQRKIRRTRKFWAGYFPRVIKVLFCFVFFKHIVTIRKTSLSNSIPFCWLNYIDISSHKLQLLCVCVLSHNWLFATPWTAAYQAPLFIGFPRQRYWNGLPFSSPGDLPDPGIEPMSLASPALTGGFFTTCATWEAPGKLQWWLLLWTLG